MQRHEFRDNFRLGRDNGQFDILISNPPYSVEAFKSTINFGEESFELYPYLTDNSSEIECLFVERMKQLLKVGGWAAVILPGSILTNSGIHAKAREILFRYFYVKGIVEMGSNTFMETGTNTTILFLERRSDNDQTVVKKEIDRFFSSKDDVVVLGIECAFSTYVLNVYENLSFADYMSFINQTPTETMKNHVLYKDYIKAFGDDFYQRAIAIEKEKMLYFLLTYSQEITLIKIGKGKNENNSRNPCKASSYIYCAFLGEQMEIDESMVHNISYGRMSGFIEYGTSKFDKVVNLGRRPKPLESRYPLIPLGELCDIKIGGTPSRDVSEYFTGNNLWVSVSELNGNVINNTKEKITDEAVKQSNVKLIPKGTTLLSFKLSIGKVAIAGSNLYTNEAVAALMPKNNAILLDKYLFIVFNERLVDLESIKGDNVFGKSLNSEQLKTRAFIPLAPLDIQQKIVEEMNRSEAESARINAMINQHQYKLSRSKATSADLPRLNFYV